MPSTVTWINPAGGYWGDPGNWLDTTTMANRVPGVSDDAVIDLGANNFTVTHSSGTDSVHSLTCRDAFNLADGSLTIAADSTISNSFTLYSVLISDATLTVTGPLDSPGCTLQGQGFQGVSCIVNYLLEDC